MGFSVHIVGSVRFVALTLCLLSSLWLTGCVHLATGESSELNLSQPRKEHTVFVATSRFIKPGLVFTNGRSSKTLYAKMTVSVPPTHRPGQIEWPRGAENIERHFVTTQKSRITGDTAFYGAVNARLKRLPAHQKNVVVFVHGYNNSFQEALYRFVQINHDFNMNSVGVYYAWPSAGRLRGYVSDRDSAYFARDGLRELLLGLQRTGAKHIYLVGHSLGTWISMEALGQLSDIGRPTLGGKLDGVILLAPDIDHAVFSKQAARIRMKPRRFLVFTARDDAALAFSKFLVGRPRLGVGITDEQFERFPVPGVTFIDVSGFVRSKRGSHNVAAQNPELIRILNALMNNQGRLQPDGPNGQPFKDGYNEILRVAEPQN